MALRVISSGIQPIGQFDGLDSQVTTMKGGEVVTLTGVTPTLYGGTDLSAADQQDGYTGTVTKTRPAVTNTLGTGAGGPYWLSDDGTTGYGTLFGSVVGGSVGQQVIGGAQLGPHTATGSGKVTCWDKPGLYAVTLDACDTAATTGLQPTNATLTVGASLYASPAGLLTPNAGLGTANGGALLAKFIEFTTDGSLVNTPNTLVSGFASPSSVLGTAAALKKFTVALFWFQGM